MTDQVVLCKSDGREIRITINRPDQRNALNRDVAEGIIAAISKAEADPGCRVIVLTGAGERAFCAGGDIKAGADGGPFVMDPSEPGHFAGQLFEKIEACKKPRRRRRENMIASGTKLVLLT